SIDEARIGSYHEGAYQIVVHKLDKLIITENDKLRGARPGLNYPIIMQGKIIGVLGITGKYAEIVDSARIIKRMTELYLQNAYNTEQKQFGRNVRNRYFDEWINGDVKNITAEFIDRGRALGFDITIPRRFMDCSVYSPTLDSGMKNMQRIESAEESITQYISSLDRNNLYFKSGASLILAVSETSDDGLHHIAQQLISVVETKYALKLAIGIDSSAESFTNAKNSYMCARIANHACMRTHKWDVRFYHDLRMELLIDDVHDATKLEFIHSLFSNYSQKEIIDAIILLENYYETDGSVFLTAERLYLHKNTLQYRLKKIAEHTGYDPRSIRHSSLFYIAISFYRDLSERGLLAKL
ncbi:MAG: sugar diacid recognition domain-containing protein, partial [Bacillota bacterium]